jgi:hypothetical protein
LGLVVAVSCGSSGSSEPGLDAGARVATCEQMVSAFCERTCTKCGKDADGDCAVASSMGRDRIGSHEMSCAHNVANRLCVGAQMQVDTVAACIAVMEEAVCATDSASGRPQLNLPAACDPLF